MEATADLLPCPLWDTSPETLTGHSPILDLVMSTPDPITPPPPPPPPPPVADSLQQQSPAQPIEGNPPTPAPTNTRRHLDFEGSSWAVYSRRPKAVSLPDPPSPRPCTRAATLKALASPARHLLPRPAVQKPRRKAIPENFVPRRSKRVQARGGGRSGGPTRSCTKAILKKLGICVDEDDREAPTPAAMERYERMFRKVLGRNQIVALASLYGWEVPSDEELQSHAAAAETPLVVTGRPHN
nr:proline-rich receptor-like protein kinase PERK8 [Lolium perenne]